MYLVSHRNANKSRKAVFKLRGTREDVYIFGSPEENELMQPVIRSGKPIYLQVHFLESRMMS